MLQWNMSTLITTSEGSVPKESSTPHQIQVCPPDQCVAVCYYMNDFTSVHCYVLFSFALRVCVLREDHHLLLQVQHRGRHLQGFASGPEFFRVQLFPQVLHG